MAELEAELGARATYFLMTQSVFYNLGSSEGRRALNRLGELEHGVGLHAGLAQRRARRPLRRGGCLARPGPDYMSEPVDGAVNVMQRPFFGPDHYRSDSNRH